MASRRRRRGRDGGGDDDDDADAPDDLATLRPVGGHVRPSPAAAAASASAAASRSRSRSSATTSSSTTTSSTTSSSTTTSVISQLVEWHQRHGLPAVTYQLVRRADLSEGWLQCPFDPAHSVPPDRYRAHLNKCKAVHDPDGRLQVCTFDETHIMPKVRPRTPHHARPAPRA